MELLEFIEEPIERPKSHEGSCSQERLSVYEHALPGQCRFLPPWPRRPVTVSGRPSNQIRNGLASYWPCLLHWRRYWARNYCWSSTSWVLMLRDDSEIDVDDRYDCLKKMGMRAQRTWKMCICRAFDGSGSKSLTSRISPQVSVHLPGVALARTWHKEKIIHRG
jgi:hypothetical protein